MTVFGRSHSTPLLFPTEIYRYANQRAQFSAMPDTFIRGICTNELHTATSLVAKHANVEMPHNSPFTGPFVYPHCTDP